MLRKTTFVTVCSWNCLSNPKRLYHSDSRSPPFFPSRREEQEERRKLSLLRFLDCFCDVQDAGPMLRFGTVLPLCRVGENLQNARPSLFTSRRPTLLCFSRGAPGRLSSGSRSCGRGATKQAFSPVLFWHRSSEGRSLLGSDSFRCTWRGDSDNHQQEATGFLLQRNLTFS